MGRFLPRKRPVGAERTDKNSTRTCPQGSLVIRTLVRYLGAYRDRDQTVQFAGIWVDITESLVEQVCQVPVTA